MVYITKKERAAKELAERREKEHAKQRAFYEKITEDEKYNLKSLEQQAEAMGWVVERYDNLREIYLHLHLIEFHLVKNGVIINFDIALERGLPYIVSATGRPREINPKAFATIREAYWYLRVILDWLEDGVKKGVID